MIPKGKYLITITDILLGLSFHIVIPTKEDLGHMLEIIPEKRYVIMAITPLGNTKEFHEFMKELIGDNRPKGLNFGQNT